MKWLLDLLYFRPFLLIPVLEEALLGFGILVAGMQDENVALAGVGILSMLVFMTRSLWVDTRLEQVALTQSKLLSDVAALPIMIRLVTSGQSGNGRADSTLFLLQELLAFKVFGIFTQTLLLWHWRADVSLLSGAEIGIVARHHQDYAWASTPNGAIFGSLLATLYLLPITTMYYAFPSLVLLAPEDPDGNVTASDDSFPSTLDSLRLEGAALMGLIPGIWQSHILPHFYLKRCLVYLTVTQVLLLLGPLQDHPIHLNRPTFAQWQVVLQAAVLVVSWVLAKLHWEDWTLKTLPTPRPCPKGGKSSPTRISWADDGKIPDLTHERLKTAHST